MKPILKIAFITLLFCIGSICVELICHLQAKGFSVEKIRSQLPYHSEWECLPPDEVSQHELRTIFSQTFSFLGDGAQCYSFVSEDGAFVIKFFKYHKMKVPFLLKVFPLPPPLSSMRDRFVKKSERRLEDTLNSCKIAYDSLKEDTGLLYLHLNKTQLWNQSLEIQDSKGIHYKIDLDQTEFVLQKRGILVFNELKHMIASSKIQETEKLIDDTLTFMYVRCLKGIKDHDGGLKRNFGLCDGKLTQLDIGSFSKRPAFESPKDIELEIRNKTKRLYHILKKKSLPLLSHYEKKLEELCSQKISNQVQETDRSSL